MKELKNIFDRIKIENLSTLDAFNLCFNLDTLNTDHITIDEKLIKWEVNIIRGSTHDGSRIFTLQNITNVILPVLKMDCYSLSNQPEIGVKLKKYNIL